MSKENLAIILSIFIVFAVPQRTLAENRPGAEPVMRMLVLAEVPSDGPLPAERFLSQARWWILTFGLALVIAGTFIAANRVVSVVRVFRLDVGESRRPTARASVLPLISIACIWLAVPLLALSGLDSFALAGALGDSFGAINSLFGGLAMVGVIVTLMLQTRQLLLQTSELKRARQQMRDQADTRLLDRYFRLLEFRRLSAAQESDAAPLAQLATDLQPLAQRIMDRYRIAARRDLVRQEVIRRVEGMRLFLLRSDGLPDDEFSRELPARVQYAAEVVERIRDNTEWLIPLLPEVQMLQEGLKELAEQPVGRTRRRNARIRQIIQNCDEILESDELHPVPGI